MVREGRSGGNSQVLLPGFLYKLFSVGPYRKPQGLRVEPKCLSLPGDMSSALVQLIILSLPHADEINFAHLSARFCPGKTQLSLQLDRESTFGAGWMLIPTPKETVLNCTYLCSHRLTSVYATPLKINVLSILLKSP